MTKDIKENKAVYVNKHSRIPKGRWGISKDLVGTFLYLCSNESNYVCGITISVYCGYYGDKN